MKNKYLFFLLAVFLTSTGGYTQSNCGFSGGVPLKENYAPLFGKDIIISDQPTEDQYKVALASAFNGWQYAVIAYDGPQVRFTILKSINNGVSWSLIMDGFFGGANQKLSSLDILVVGDSDTNLKILLSTVSIDKNSTTLSGIGYVDVYNEQNGNWEKSLLIVQSCYDISLESDYLHPAANSNPNSVGILYSRYSSSGDSIIFCSSSDGGLNIDGQQVVAVSQNHFHKVDLAYGFTPSWSTGRYFAVWEESNGYGIPGHIYTSHSNPYFNSSFTTPVNIDGLDPSTANQCQNPVIACQNNGVDNDSSSLTEVIMFEKYNPAGSKYDIGAYYNLQSTSSSFFKPMSFTDPSHNNIQPDLDFNPYDSSFMLTYFDSTTMKLPFLRTNFDIPDPNDWLVVSSGYNDNSDITNPWPKVELNIGQPEAMNAWISNRPDGKGIALFDSPNNTWTGFTENNLPTEDMKLGIYPNPCNSWVTIWFELKKNTNVTIKACTSMGQSAAVFTDQNYKAGKQELKCNVSNLLPGSYILKLQTEEGTKSTKLIVVR